MKTSMKLFLLSSLLTFVTQGCRCGGPAPLRAKGDVRIIYTDADGTQTSSPDDGVYDFGTVSMGKTAAKKMTVQNVGLGSLVVQRFTKVSGDPVKVGTFIEDASPVFNVDFSSEVVVASGESAEFDISFTPPVVENVTQVSHETVLTMTSGETEPGRENASVTLQGKAVSGECDLPATIDFGAVARGDSYSIEFAYVNQRPIETRAYLGPIESQQEAGIFAISPDSPKGDFLLGPMNTKVAKFTFKPTEGRDYLATVVMRRGEGCPEKPVRLIGLGVDAVLSWTPSAVDFGYTCTQDTCAPVVREVTFSNQGLRPITLGMLATRDGASASTVFKVSETASADLTTLVVPAGVRQASSMPLVPGMIVPGTATLKVAFKPVVLGPRTGQLVGVTELASQPMISISLRGVGGGPDIDVRPSPTLNFGRIAYFAGATPPSFSNRKLTIQNVGTRPSSPDPQANLKLGKPDGAGGFMKPYWEVTPKNGASLSEICLGTFDTATSTCADDLPTSGAGKYDVVQGLEAGGATSILEIPVRITPNGLGQREFEVKLYSNDPDEPVTTITVTAESVVLPPCSVEISPIALAFGIVSPPSIKDLGFSIRNRLTGPNDICHISNLELLPETGTPTGMPAVFSLPGGAINELDLMPAETKQVMVRAWPQGQVPPNPAQVVGKVSFNLADPVSSLREVTVTATIANSCLTISPSALDFGTVKKDCNSADRNFQIYNSCSAPVTINTATMGSAAGEGPMGPNCPGSAPCPEFFVVTGIANGTVLAAGSSTPVTFSLKYRPINYGPDTGAFVINATHNGGTSLDYVVALEGKGDMQGLNTDTFRQDAKPKADILLVIDDSCSMGDKQTALAANMSAFLQYATTNQVDFQMGVTNTELTDPTRGILKRTTAGNKILRPTTPNLSSEFSALVNVGTNGASESCMEPATLALTAPYITDPAKNAGFLRPDAVLAVVCVTDARDQAPQAPVFYLNQLLNVKGAQNASQFSYNVVGPFLPSAPSGCAYDDTNDGRHDLMVTQTNGVKEEICTPNWAASLERIGKNAFGYRTNFYLTARPDLSAPTGIQVAIEGTAIPAIDPVRMARIWQYDSVNNTVNFDPLYVPEPGKTLTITYQANCIL